MQKNDALVPEAWELHFVTILKKNNISFDFYEIYREKRKKLTYFFQLTKNLNSSSLQTPYLQASFRFNLSKVMVQNWTFTYDLETWVKIIAQPFTEKLCYAKYESDRVKWRVDVLNLNNDFCVF